MWTQQAKKNGPGRRAGRRKKQLLLSEQALTSSSQTFDLWEAVWSWFKTTRGVWESVWEITSAHLGTLAKKQKSTLKQRRKCCMRCEIVCDLPSRTGCRSGVFHHVWLVWDALSVCAHTHTHAKCITYFLLAENNLQFLIAVQWHVVQTTAWVLNKFASSRFFSRSSAGSAPLGSSSPVFVTREPNLHLSILTIPVLS